MSVPNEDDLIVTPSELKDYMSGLELDSDQSKSALDVLAGLQRELERYCQRWFKVVERTELIYPDDAGRLWPKATPVISVSSPAGLYPNGNMLGGTYPITYGVYDLSSGFAGGGVNPPVSVTYVGGVSGKDEHDIRVAILRAAAREMAVRHDDTLTTEDLTPRRPPPSDDRETGFTEDELKKFDRLRRRTVA